MPIQFCCSQCGQPIEVDDEHAGKTAACPYCQHLIAVPQETTFRAEGTPTARPAGGLAGPPDQAAVEPTGAVSGLPHRPPPIPPPRLRAATTLGAYALICAILALGLFGVGVSRGLVLLYQSGQFSPSSQPRPDEIARWQRQASADPWIIGPQLGGMFFGLMGLILGIVGLTQAARGNWRAITALILSGLLVLCVCGGTLAAAVLLRGAAPGA